MTKIESFILPDGFDELLSFASWALPSADLRQNRRLAATSEELKALYRAVQPRLADALEEVDKFEMGSLPDKQRNLFYILLSLAEIAPHVELYNGATGVPHAFDESRFVAVHGRQDTAEERAAEQP